MDCIYIRVQKVQKKNKEVQWISYIKVQQSENEEWKYQEHLPVFICIVQIKNWSTMKYLTGCM